MGKQQRQDTSRSTRPPLCLLHSPTRALPHPLPPPTQDGLGETWAVNTVAPFLLTGGLLDLITQRIVNVSSISMADRLDWDRLQQVGVH